jgi:diguanylate cyclase (GGDEF)-like protein/PAS domain S-box-containing protein
MTTSLRDKHYLFCSVITACLLFMLCQPAIAIDAVSLNSIPDRVDLADYSEFYSGRAGRLELETAADVYGVKGRMVVRSKQDKKKTIWMVFALINPYDRPVERLLSVERYSVVASKFLWPDLDRGRIVSVTPSSGFLPADKSDSVRDIYSLSVDAGQTVTFVVELSSIQHPPVYLWHPDRFEKKLRNSELFNGILLGITVVLAIFLTVIFAVNHSIIFPAAAIIAWSILAYLLVDFGLWHSLFQLGASGNAAYRAASEAAIVASTVAFLFVFLRINLWHGWIRWLFVIWISIQALLVVTALFYPVLISGITRFSYAVVAITGTLIIAYLAARGQARALSIIPMWILLLVWIFGAMVAISGGLSGDIVSIGLLSGLVLIVATITLTATQYAFIASTGSHGAPIRNTQIFSMAISKSGAYVWEWGSRRNEIIVDKKFEERFGLSWGTLNGKAENWLMYLHPFDREKFLLSLGKAESSDGGNIDIDFRMRRSDGCYLWCALEAGTLRKRHSASVHCVGLIRDITDVKNSNERLMHDAVHDSLTGLPNREIFFDRLEAVLSWNEAVAVILLDMDRFKNINGRYGISMGDGMLLAISRKLSRYIGSRDTLARIDGDQFAVILTGYNSEAEIRKLVDDIRTALRVPTKIAGEEVIMTGSTGIAMHDGTQASGRELFREAENAMYAAKRFGSDCVEFFRPEMRRKDDDRVLLESDLRQAIQRNQIDILYQPIMRLARNELAGFEALIRWNHPGRGLILPSEFISIAEDNGMIVELGEHVLNSAVKDLANWNRLLPRADNALFVSVNISSRELLRQDLVNNVRHIFARQSIPKGSLRLEITETMVMENPEQAVEILDWLKTLGAGLSMDDFGAGYSSLGYMHRFPFDTIKIDKSLLEHRGGMDKLPVMLRSIINLVHEMEMEVVAEGVETAEDAKYLRSLGCNYAQGFYFGEPMNDREVVSLLKVLAKSAVNNG